MKYNEVRHKGITCLSFMKDTDNIMYVGPKLSWFKRRKLQSKDIKVPVLYLPDILKSISAETKEYYCPGTDASELFSAENFYNQIYRELEGKYTNHSQLLLRYDGNDLVIFEAKNGFRELYTYLTLQYPNPKSYEEQEGEVMFSLTSGKNGDQEADIDQSLDEEMMKSAEEVHEALKNLLLKGFPLEIIQSWLGDSVKLSRLKITRQYKILLVDYNQEIKMGPLPKTLFLFYLRHPEGVMFSHLQDYKVEIMDIYSRVCVIDDLQKIEESIERLVNPFDNSICEKVAAIKKAFILKVNDTVAKNYYVYGPQGEKKSISLDRALVEWE